MMCVFSSRWQICDDACVEPCCTESSNWPWSVLTFVSAANGQGCDQRWRINRGHIYAITDHQPGPNWKTFAGWNLSLQIQLPCFLHKHYSLVSTLTSLCFSTIMWTYIGVMNALKVTLEEWSWMIIKRCYPLGSKNIITFPDKFPARIWKITFCV